MTLDEQLARLQADIDQRFASMGIGGQTAARSVVGGSSADVSPNAPAAAAPDGPSLFCPECGTRLPAGARFCMECGTRIELESPATVAKEEVPVPNPASSPSCGVLLTDTRRLSQKYGCDTDEVAETLDTFIQTAGQHGMTWHLLDVAEELAGASEDEHLWLEYNELLSEFIAERQLPLGPGLPVFIIGGHDVVPIPMIEDPFGSSDDGRIPCDMAYCFEGNFFSDLWDGGDRRITDDYVRNNVSRLPLEDGELEDDIDDDLGAYLARCQEYYADGIEVSSVMMQANSAWLPASRTMSEFLPLVTDTDDEEYVDSNMYVSPPVSTEDDDSNAPLRQTLESAQMLLFNLHGSDGYNDAGFYSNVGEAFNTDLLDDADQTRVFNTVACYGARYHGYDSAHSMLLYFKGVLLYAGSLISVPMTELNVPDGVEVHDGSGSEHLMPIYCMELYKGLPAGEAMMRAKLEYFETFRHMERDDFSMATAMMFSLYGNPMLHVQRDEEVLRQAEQEHVLPRLPEQKAAAPISRKRIQHILTKDNGQEKSLLGEVRGLVDANLAAIHQQVQQHLYDTLGLEPRWLDHVDAFTIEGTKSQEQGYAYTYIDLSRPYGQRSMVEVDKRGKVKRVFRTK